MIGVTSLLEQSMNRRQLFTHLASGACGSVISKSGLHSLSEATATMQKKIANISEDVLRIKDTVNRDRCSINRKLNSMQKAQKIMATAIVAVALLG